jgi:hypothetical protein
MSEELPCVTEALQRVAQEIGPIAKDRQVTTGPARYSFRGIDDVLTTIHDSMAKHGVSFVPYDVTIHDQTIGQTRSGSAQLHLLATVHYQIVGPAGDAISAGVLAEAQDTSDKAASKLMSMAYKYLAFQVLSIPVEGALEESDSSSEERAPAPRLISDPQKAAMWVQAKRLGMDLDGLSEYVAQALGKRKPRSGQAFLASLTSDEAVKVLGALETEPDPEAPTEGAKDEVVEALRQQVADYQNLSGPTEVTTEGGEEQ